MKSINTYITEKLKISQDVINNNDYEYIDKLPLGQEKSEKVFNIINDRYGKMFDDVRLLRSGNTKLGFINRDYLVDNGLYNESNFTLYIYDDEYVMRRSITGSVGKFVKGLNSLEKTLEKFDKLLTKRGYKIPK